MKRTPLLALALAFLVAAVALALAFLVAAAASAQERGFWVPQNDAVGGGSCGWRVMEGVLWQQGHYELSKTAKRFGPVTMAQLVVMCEQSGIKYESGLGMPTKFPCVLGVPCPHNQPGKSHAIALCRIDAQWAWIVDPNSPGEVQRRPIAQVRALVIEYLYIEER